MNKYTLLIDEPGRSYHSAALGRTLTTTQRRVEIHCDGKRVMDFVTVSRSRPTAKHPQEIVLARRVLAFLNS